MTVHLYRLPPREVMHAGELHMHSTVGPVDDDEAQSQGLEQWLGMDSKRVVDCEKCQAKFKVHQAQWRKKFSIKYNLPDDFWEGR